MNIEKIKNFSKEEQKALEYFELLRNEIVARDNELNEGINFIFGRNFASKIDKLLNLVITLQEDKEELMRKKEKIIPILINDKMYFLEQNLYDDIIEVLKSKYISVQKVKDKIEEVKEFSENAISSVGHQLTIEILQELLEGDN